MAGQLIGDNILIFLGQPRFVFAARAVSAAIHLVFNYFYFPETLAPSKRKPFTGPVNPLASAQAIRWHAVENSALD